MKKLITYLSLYISFNLHRLFLFVHQWSFIVNSNNWYQSLVRVKCVIDFIPQIHIELKIEIITILILGDWKTRVLVRIEWFAQEQRWTEKTVAWIQSFQYSTKIIEIGGRFIYVCYLALKMFVISSKMVTRRLQKIQHKRKKMRNVKRGRRIRRHCSISISVWIRMCLRRLSIRWRRRRCGIHLCGAMVVTQQWRK